MSILQDMQDLIRTLGFHVIWLALLLGLAFHQLVAAFRSDMRLFREDQRCSTGT